MFDWRVFKEAVGIPMGTNYAAHLLTDFFLFAALLNINEK
jgi:hypothetical protein